MVRRPSRGLLRVLWVTGAFFCLVVPAVDHRAMAEAAPNQRRLQAPAQNPAPQPDADSLPKKHVLLLYSNVFGLPAHRKNNQAFLSVMDGAGVSPANVHHEFLDLVRNSSASYRALLREFLREKYLGAEIAVIVTVDGAAQDFILSEGRELFPGAVVVSVLAPRRLREALPGRRVIQIPAVADLAGTLEIAIDLFPSTRHMLLVVGDSEDEKSWLALAHEAFAPWAGTLEIETTDGRTLAEVLQRAASLPPESIVFYLSFYRDRTGRTFVPRTVAERVIAASERPVFGLYDGLIGAGIVGGSLFSYEAEGERSGRLASDILSGRLNVTEPLTILASSHKPMFDWRQLRRWGIGEGELPAGSIIVNRPLSIWEQHRKQVVVSAVVLLLQAFLIAMLLLQRRLKRSAERAIRQQLSRLRQLNQITRAVAERQESESMLHVVLKQLVGEFPVQAALVARYDQPVDAFTVAVQEVGGASGDGVHGWQEGTKIPVDEADLRTCLSGATLYRSDTATLRDSLSLEAARQGLGCLIASPLVAGTRIFGVVAVFRSQPRGFSGGEVDFMSQLSEHLALAMHQAQLYENLRLAYNELKATQEVVMAQERLRALGQMSSGIAHDINNALSPIVMNAELILLRETCLSDSSRHYLQMIQLAASDIESTVGRMREFYRPRDREEILLPVDLNAVVREVIDLTQPRWRDMPQRSGRVIDVVTQLQPELPAILGVRSELREALTNLILNAADAMPGGGTITIGTEVAPDAAGNARTALWVRDTGVGMDEETKQHCLEPFYTKKGERGTGLGLALVYGTVERHHGAIEIESEPGRGSTFRLLFPVAPPAGAVPVLPAESPSYAGPPLRILCIDDEPLVREGLKDLLVGGGHTVSCAPDGRSGLEAFHDARQRGAPFQVVFTDLGMPQVDGREVAAKIREVSPETPVILLTGWGEQMKIEGPPPPGVELILSKPPRLTDLWRALAHATARRSTPAPRTHAAASAAGEETAVRPLRGTILVMDDDDNVHLLAARAFRELGYAVEGALSGTEAVERYKRRMELGEPYAAVLLDLNLPGGIGGVEVAARLRALDPAVRAFVASGTSDDPAVRDFESYGFVGVLNKPFRMKDLAEAVQRFRTA